MKEERRSIDIRFWTDPDIEDMSMEATYLYLSLLTCPENNMSGVFELSDKKISIYTKMEKGLILSAIRELQASEKILRDKSWVCIRNHIKNQNLNGGMAISVVKSLCVVPNYIKLWLFFREDSEELEEWFSNLTFNVNQYYKEQKGRKATAIVNAAKKNNERLIHKEVMDSLPDIEFKNEDLIKVLTNNMPFKPKELSNYNSMITVIEGLDNLSMNMNTEYRKLNRNINTEKEKEKLNAPDTDPKKQPFEQYVPPERRKQSTSSILDDSINYWNSKQGLPKTRKLTVNLGEKAKPIIQSISLYSIDEIKSAIDNYSTIQGDQEKYKPVATYGDVFGFLNTGIEKYWDESQPLKLMKIEKGMSEAEKISEMFKQRDRERTEQENIV